MKTFLFFTLLCLGYSLMLSAQTLKLYNENKEQGLIVYADNPELYPVSISLDLDIQNFEFSEGDKKIFVIPAKSEKFRIGECTMMDKSKKSKFSYKYKAAMGDITITNYDKSFAYDLPFQKGKSFGLFQGYNGRFSHQNENALDFTMPEGTEILAAREGLVVQVVQHNTESCPRKECMKFNNHITILHSDGTFANYTHIKHNGAKFKLGDQVKKGETIAYSGNVGWTSGPHLHFVCYLGGFDHWNTIETKFRTDKGDNAKLLTEGNTYLRDY